MTLGLRFLHLLGLLAPLLASGAMPQTDTYDIVVYGGTSSGVIAAVQAGHMGKKVVLIEPGSHLGGMAASGLGMTDIGDKAVMGGLAREFYRRAYRYYRNPAVWKYETRDGYAAKERSAIDEPTVTQFFMEPHVAEHLFTEWLKETGVPVLLRERLDRRSGVTKEGTRLLSLRMESGRVIAGRMFIDATYEGDLLAAAGVSYTLGRESNARYGETLNGIRYLPAEKVSPFVVPGDPASGLLPGLEPAPPGPEGAGDRRVQTYNFRVCLTDVPENRVPIEKPADYNPAYYELTAREFVFRPDHFPGRSLFKLSPMPNRKTDSNNHSRFSTDFVGHNYAWAEADYDQREAIWRAHRDYTLGFFWFLGHDERVPANVRAEVLRWGLPKDEFRDGEHWPWQLYIREARRMVGEYVVTEHDCTGGTVARDPVAMGSYHMDSHQTSRYVDRAGRLHVEGGFFQSVAPFGVSYRALVPRADECSNLLAPVCLSSSHVAYGSIRMEPVFMILGQSAATAAALAIDREVPVQAVPYAELRERLLRDGQVLAYTPPPGWRKSLDEAQVRGAVAKLEARGFLDDGTYWLDHTAGTNLCDGGRVAALLLAVARLRQPADNVDDAVSALVSDRSISRGDYWRSQAVDGKSCNGRFVAQLLTDLARLL